MYDKIKELNKDKKGLVGIGTLIIFIAMVIVAAVAAGVLINTSQSLQEQARATGEETIRSVSSGVEVSAVKGQTNSSAEMDSLEMIVSTYPGSDGIDLTETVIQLTTQGDMGHLNYTNDATAENGFEVTKIENVSNTKENLLGPGDTVQISIENNTISPKLNLEGGDSASLTFIPPEGFDTYYGVNVPTVVRQNTWYEM